MTRRQVLMRARITLAFVAILAVALLIAGGVSLLLVRQAERHAAVETVLHQANALVAVARRLPAGSNPSTPSNSQFDALLPLLHSIAGLSPPTILVINAHHRLVYPPPAGVPAGSLDLKRLAAGHSIAGSNANTAFAAARLLRLPNGFGKASGEAFVLMLLSTINYGSDSASYFLVAAGISLVVAAALAAGIGQRISRRVVIAGSAAERIAAGDLGTRIDVVRRDYPELVALATSINTMAARLEAARHLERQFLLSVSHDLRTPLTSIRGYAEAIAEGVVPDAAVAAGVVLTEARRLERLIGDLLDLARLDANRFTLQLAPLDLAAVVTSAAEALRYELDAFAIELTIDAPESVEFVGDADRLRQIVANLVENSLKFTDSLVRVTVHGSAAGVAITVEDDGVGIDPADLPHIFERLFVSSRHAARAAGTGLGLAIVAELTEAMGGKIDVSSPIHDGTGTRVAITLPRPAAIATSSMEQ